MNKKLRKVGLDTKQKVFGLRTLQLISKIETGSKGEKVTISYPRRAFPQYRSFDDFQVKVDRIRNDKDLALREKSRNYKKDTFTFLSFLDKSKTPFTDYINQLRGSKIE
jgi:hypothetical protein